MTINERQKQTHTVRYLKVSFSLPSITALTAIPYTADFTTLSPIVK